MADTSAGRRLKDNVQALIKRHKRSWNYVAKEAKLGGSGSEALQEMRPIGLDRLDRIAAVFGLEALQLLVPNLDPDNLPVKWLGREEAKKHAKLERAQKVLEEQG